MTGQHMQALERANAARAARTAQGRKIGALSYRDGCDEAARILESPSITSSQVGGMTATKFLMMVHKVGPQNAAAFLRCVGLRDTNRRVRDLTVRQRASLAVLLRSHT